MSSPQRDRARRTGPVGKLSLLGLTFALVAGLVGPAVHNGSSGITDAELLEQAMALSPRQEQGNASVAEPEASGQANVAGPKSLQAKYPPIASGAENVRENPVKVEPGTAQVRGGAGAAGDALAERQGQDHRHQPRCGHLDRRELRARLSRVHQGGRTGRRRRGRVVAPRCAAWRFGDSRCDHQGDRRRRLFLRFQHAAPWWSVVHGRADPAHPPVDDRLRRAADREGAVPAQRFLRADSDPAAVGRRSRRRCSGFVGAEVPVRSLRKVCAEARRHAHRGVLCGLWLCDEADLDGSGRRVEMEHGLPVAGLRLRRERREPEAPAEPSADGGAAAGDHLTFVQRALQRRAA